MLIRDLPSSFNHERLKRLKLEGTRAQAAEQRALYAPSEDPNAPPKKRPRGRPLGSKTKVPFAFREACIVDHIIAAHALARHAKWDTSSQAHA
jgi:hypothetical protein